MCQLFVDFYKHAKGELKSVGTVYTTSPNPNVRSVDFNSIINPIDLLKSVHSGLDLQISSLWKSRTQEPHIDETQVWEKHLWDLLTCLLEGDQIHKSTVEQSPDHASPASICSWIIKQDHQLMGIQSVIKWLEHLFKDKRQEIVREEMRQELDGQEQGMTLDSG